MPTSRVKVVDFGSFLDGSDKPGVAKAILESFKTIGFVYLTNHGLLEDEISEMFRWSKLLFSQPMEVKQLAPHPASGAHHRGYSAPGREKVKKFGSDDPQQTSLIDSAHSDVPRDIKESFEIGKENNEDMPNIWFPNGVFPGFREASMKFYWACFETEKQILRALALGFDLPEDYFLSYHSQADNQLRLLHYPSVSAHLLQNENSSRIPSHSDFCSMTLLMQDEIGGLEVEDPGHPGEFISVPPIPGSIVVNAGDFLMRWSNDTIKSTIHRVRSPTAASASGGSVIPERYSIPYFCGADSSTIVDCIPGTWSEERPKLYPPISAREYVTKRLSLNY